MGLSTSPTSADEVQADEVTRASRAASDAEDLARGGPGPGCEIRRDLQSGRRRGFGWTLMRYFLRATCPEGCLACGVVQRTGESQSIASACAP